MLIKCPECGKDISDKAISCPNCGYPINVPSYPTTALKRANKPHKFRRLPNGYGSIKRLTGNRRKPFGAYPPVTEYKDNGVAVTPRALGYFETYQEAMDCLIQFNKAPFDVKKRDYTFEQVYQMYYADKFNEKNKRQYSEASKASTYTAFKNLSNLHNMKFSELRTAYMQEQIDNCPLKHASLELMVALLKNMSKYAIKNDIISKDYAAFVKINIPDDDEKGVPLTNEELKILWKNKDDEAVKIILIMVYTGLRISELTTIKPDFDKRIMKCGLKTKAGINRTVPIHKDIADFLKEFNPETFSPQKYRQKEFIPTMQRLGLEYAKTGEKRTPHDARHTFSWLADSVKMDQLSKHLIMGHSLTNSDIETSVYGHRTDKELIKEIDKIKTPRGK